MIKYQPDWTAVMLDDERFKLEQLPGGAGDDDGGRIQLTHIKSGIKVDVPVSVTAKHEERLREASALYKRLVDAMVEAKYHEFGTHHFARLLRCVYANKLIEVISSYGRAFFYSSGHDRIAQMVYDYASTPPAVYLIDEKSARQVVLRNNGDWAGFGHNGMLRDLVMQLRDYVMKGVRIDMEYIGLISPLGKSNAWGYPQDQMEKCRQAAVMLPCMAQFQSPNGVRAA
ncbi:hypothetical protein EGJ51_17885 [Pseudomonas fulva]|uniref:Uncharacterized protein n=1 Tax=Pseudomonas parafulva TaxID=157782 RepID=A0AAJ0LIR4_9PSED|nr:MULTISPECIES: hypothetical protein [Pseudomonas]KTT16912.1 hypothetical protein NS96R_14280 [Pseudomonas parafulva]MBA1218196.1 hypothetical protein [Pseudomonas fulva]RRW59510.1 hypothetical protein EGJ51_17885 [Pseudomonas fulva]